MSIRSAAGKVWLIVLAVPFVLCSLAIGAIALINFRDEPLRPEVSAALTARHEAIAPAENLFFAVLAFDVQSSSDLNADGQRLYANYLAAAQSASNAPLTLAHDPAFPRQAFLGDKNQLCGLQTKQEDCIERVAANPAGMQALVADNTLLIDRYQSLQAYRHFEDRLHPTRDSPIITWTPFLLAKRLFLTSIAIDCAQGRLAAGIVRLRADAAFTRGVLAEPDVLLIDKMILAVSLRDSLLLAADILRRGPLTAADYVALREIAAPFSVQERSLKDAQEREFEILTTVLVPLGNPENRSQTTSVPESYRMWSAVGRRIARHFFKLNATLNDAWLANERIWKSDAGSCRDWRAGTLAVGEQPHHSLIDYAYNPIGKILVRATLSGGLGMDGALCDLEAMQRIVASQASIHSQGIADQDIAGFIEHVASELTDPFTGEPFRWDAAARGVTFDVAADRDRKFVPWPL